MTTSPERRQLAVVTGASTGIGAATARRLAADGFHVLAGVRREADGARLATDGIEPVILDITRQDHVAALADRVASDPRPLWALVNNAGIAVNAPVEVVALDEWRRQFEVSVFAQIGMTQALLPALFTSRGRVVNIGSVGGKIAMPAFGPYSAAKFAMEAVSDTLRRELAASGVRVVVITPGAVRTSLTERGNETASRLAGSMTADQRARYARLVQAHRETTEGFEKNGVAPEKAAAVISRAIGARRPRTRYTVGPDAAFMVPLSRFVPDRLFDLVLRRQMRLDRPASTPARAVHAVHDQTTTTAHRGDAA